VASLTPPPIREEQDSQRFIDWFLQINDLLENQGVVSVTDLILSGSLTVDGTTDSTSGTTGSIQTDGGLGVVKNVFTDATFNAGGDTSAGDKSTLGYTSAEGAILTGQGSTSDITLKNDADETVLSIPTGTESVVIGDGQLADAATDGFLYTPTTTAGAPTGTPGSFAGRVPWVYDDTNNVIYVYNSGWQAFGNASEKAWAFASPAGSTGTFYWGGFYIDAGSDNDFNPSVNLGTANKSYAAHVYVVAASGATDTEITVTGTSITDAAVRTTSDTEVISLTDASADVYYETSKKFLGLVTVNKTAGTDRLCNYGWAKYWDNNNSDFNVVGMECTGLAGANDTGFNIELLHHKSTGWTYNNGSSATSPTAIASLQTDHNTEYELANGQEFAYKRSNLSTAVSGSGSEGTMFRITTTANKAVELATLMLRITPG